MSLRIHRFDPTTAPDEVIRGLYDVAAAVNSENHPDDPPPPFEYYATRWRAPVPEHERHTRFYAEENGTVAGYVSIFSLPFDDPANMSVGIWVLPSMRRRGVGRSLLAHAIGQAGEAEKLIVDTVAGRPWEPALERLGLRHVFTARRSRLVLEDLDWERMDRWTARARERAADYELIDFEMRIPDEHLESWAMVKNVMNTAPEEDLDIEDFNMTPEKWRHEEDAIEVRGDNYLAIGALHRPSGRFAGLTDVFLPRLYPQQAWQEDTGVDPEHRNRGLGRWLKAEMVKRIAREHPEVRWIDTANADSNEPMLAINVEMGFRPVLIENAWQGLIADVRRNMSSGTVSA